jgi:hybrid cluster-associated redox disulfide protein
MTNKKITKETNIMEAIDLNPNTAEILMDAGLGCIGCSLAHAETLEQGLMAHGFEGKEIDELIEKLNK